MQRRRVAHLQEVDDAGAEGTTRRPRFEDRLGCGQRWCSSFWRIAHSVFEARKKLSSDNTFEDYDKARTTWAAFYDAFDAHMREDTRGLWGDYSFKLLIDVACNMSLPSIKDSHPVCPDGVMSRWPVGCPAYRPGLRLLLKPRHKRRRHNRCVKRQLLVCVHKVLSGRLGANHHNVTSTLAQLCWQLRNTA